MELARWILIGMIVVGSGFIAYSIIMFVLSLSAQVIEGEIIDFPYHWTTRGFIRRKRIQYVFNGKEYFYDTKVGTIARRSGPAKIRVGKHGVVYERASYVYNFFLGALIAGLGIYIIQFIK